MLLLLPMQTQCPHCQTLFHVTDEQLQIADSQVRCGECDEIFTATIIPTPDAPILTENDDPELSIDELSVDVLDDVQLDVMDIVIPDLEPTDNAQIPESSETIAQQESVQDDHAPTQNQPSLRLVNNDRQNKSDPEHTPQTELNTAQTGALAFNTAANAANVERDEVEPEKAEELPEEGYDPSQLYPELESVPGISPPMPTSYLIVSTILILLFIGQSIYLLRDNIASHGFRPLMQSLCDSLDCELALPRAPNEVVLKSREIRSHPNVKNALSVKASISNQASFRQAFPLLQIQFHDIEGRIIAGRDFLPQEYLPDDINAKKGLAPNNPVNIALELIDPGKNAVSFIFIFK